MRRLKLLAFVLMLVVMVSGCGSSLEQLEEKVVMQQESETVSTPDETADTEPEAEAEEEEVLESESEPEPEPEPADDAIFSADEYLAVRPNEIGHVMVVMYHGILNNPPYHRTKEDFLKDLAFMYEHGYYLVSVSDFMDMAMDVPVGKTPIVLTFDDGLSSTFNLIETDHGLVVDPESAIGLLESFAAEHPDFGKTATLFIHVSGNFKGAGTEAERLKWLVDNGYELGNHSATHEDLSVLGSAALQRAIGRVNQSIAGMLPGYTIDTMTYPFGKRPQSELLPVFADGSYEGIDYHYRVGFREGPSATFRVPLHVKYDPLNAPRVRGSEGDIQDLWWFLDYYETNMDYRYVSDGNEKRLSIPADSKEWVDASKANGSEIYYYDTETGEQVLPD